MGPVEEGNSSGAFIFRCGPFKFGALALIVALGLMQSNAAPLWVEASGTVRVSRQTTDGQEIADDSYTAPVSVRLSDDGKFIIRLLNHNFYKRREIVFSFDGTNFFYLIPKGNETRLGDSKKAADFKMDLGTCYLSSEEIPLVLIQDHARDALWYALGSGNYFKKHGETGEVPDLFYSPRRSTAGYGYRYKVALTNSIFCVPYSLDLWRDKKFDRQGGSRQAEEDRLELNTDGRGTMVFDGNWATKRAIPENRHMLSLVWKRDCLIEDQRLPLEVEITDFYTWGPPTNPCVTVKLEFESWRTSTVDSNETFRPDPTQPTKVLDARVRMRQDGHYLDDLVYTVGTKPTNSFWRARDDAWLQRGAAEVFAGQYIPGQKERFRIWMLILLFAVIAPIFLWLISRKQARSDKAASASEPVPSENKQNKKTKE